MAEHSMKSSQRPVVVILAAGLGSRLGMSKPKALAELSDGRTILARQLDNVRSVWGEDVSVILVVGFKLDQLMEAAPDVLYAYNESFDSTNTSKSLLRALRLAPAGPVVWMNGDVVFDQRILCRLEDHMQAGRNAVCVNTDSVGEEEVKYTVDSTGHIDQISKTVSEGLGESVGINLISEQSREILIKHLAACDDQDYFERGIETAIASDGLRVLPVDISDLFAVEVDFAADLERARSFPGLKN